jgi:hypothetical protein
MARAAVGFIVRPVEYLVNVAGGGATAKHTPMILGKKSRQMPNRIKALSNRQPGGGVKSLKWRQNP